MSILNIQRIAMGQVGVKPGTIKLTSTDSLSAITTAGYLKKDINGINITGSDVIEALYSFNETTGVGSFDILTVSISAAGVVTLNVDTAIADGGVTTAKLANLAVTTAKIADANVTLAKLAAGIAPSHVVKFAGTHAYGGGGTSTAIPVAGLLATDIPGANIQASTNTVSIVKVVPTANTITVHFSADPGAATVVSYSALRAAV